MQNFSSVSLKLCLLGKKTQGHVIVTVLENPVPSNTYFDLNLVAIFKTLNCAKLAIVAIEFKGEPVTTKPY